jgi:hypothetical protein
LPVRAPLRIFGPTPPLSSHSIVSCSIFPSK